MTPKERPILFSGPMVRALLDGRKTQTRRTIKPQPEYERGTVAPQALRGDPPKHPAPYFDAYNGGPFWCWWDEYDRQGAGQTCPYGKPGDRLWVKETWRPSKSAGDWDIDVRYEADGLTRTVYDGEFGDRDWSMPKAAARGNVSPLFMPRWAARLVLEITEVRVERLNVISEADAQAEGSQEPSLLPIIGACWSERDAFAKLWEHINGAGSWASNPWVWAVSFRVLSNEERQASIRGDEA
ncbi:hypothetical protein [Brevundimonas diminuta]|uniref:hypothetical protein n=1 Tax=Brevundimonas diminuta TaxID=293 RepID=UPI0030F5BC6E